MKSKIIFLLIGASLLILAADHLNDFRAQPAALTLRGVVVIDGDTVDLNQIDCPVKVTVGDSGLLITDCQGTKYRPDYYYDYKKFGSLSLEYLTIQPPDREDFNHFHAFFYERKPTEVGQNTPEDTGKNRSTPLRAQDFPRLILP